MTDGVTFLPDIFDFGILTKHKFMKKYAGAGQSQLRLNMKNRLCGYYIPKAHVFGRKTEQDTQNCS
jgi:hypothetical protein